MDRKDATEALTQFTWERQPEAERLVRDLVAKFLEKCPEAATLADRMRVETGTRFVDWVDSITLRWNGQQSRDQLETAGYTCMSQEEADPGGATAVFAHGGGVFPRIVLS